MQTQRAHAQPREFARPKPPQPAATPDPTEKRESDRLEALDYLDILDTPREEAFDRVTRLARKLFDVPIALVSFIDGHRQWYKASEGMDVCEVPRQDTFCRHVIAQEQTLIVPDASKDPRFSENPRVTGEPHVRFYAGVPIKSKDGHSVGTVCLIDTHAREFSEEETQSLTDLAHMVGDELELRQFISTDTLTGAMSRRAFRDELSRATLLALRHHDELSVVGIDLDHFKNVNDTHGHAAGDQVLRAVVEACRGELRQTDLVGRLGGEEFAVLLPQTGAAGGMEAAERIRKAIAAKSIPVGEGELRVTASLGVASLDLSTRDADALLSRADAALYEAKAAGRNRSVAWRDEVAAPQLPGRRVLKRGQIFFNGRLSSMDCTVRRLSDQGASFDVSSTAGIPTRFDLSIAADHFEKPCRVVASRERQVDVVFV